MEAAGERLAFFRRGEKSSLSRAPMLLYRPADSYLNLAKVQQPTADATLCDLAAVANCQVCWWLLSVEEAAELDTPPGHAYDIVLRRTSSDAPSDHSEAMGALAVAVSSARIEAEAPRRARCDAGLACVRDSAAGPRPRVAEERCCCVTCVGARCIATSAMWGHMARRLQGLSPSRFHRAD